jgi:ketosteroid isomerase-like protein
MNTSLRFVAEQLLVAITTKDLHSALACFAADAVMIDPHYPTATMRGHAAIADGLMWAFGNVASFGFTIVQYCAAADGGCAAIEVATDHRLRGGMRVRLTQTFVMEASDGKLTRVQAYTPYGPPGIGALALTLTRMARRGRRLSRSGPGVNRSEADWVSRIARGIHARYDSAWATTKATA